MVSFYVFKVAKNKYVFKRHTYLYKLSLCKSEKMAISEKFFFRIFEKNYLRVETCISQMGVNPEFDNESIVLHEY